MSEFFEVFLVFSGFATPDVSLTRLSIKNLLLRARGHAHFMVTTSRVSRLFRGTISIVFWLMRSENSRHDNTKFGYGCGQQSWEHFSCFPTFNTNFRFSNTKNILFSAGFMISLILDVLFSPGILNSTRIASIRGPEEEIEKCVSKFRWRNSRYKRFSGFRKHLNYISKQQLPIKFINSLYPKMRQHQNHVNMQIHSLTQFSMQVVFRK